MPSSPPPAPSARTAQDAIALRTQLLSDADRCVKCAVCLPQCPTYTLHGDESESPRGRISLMQGLLLEQLDCSDSVRQSLNNCLNCGRCERACPAQVPFTRLIDGVRGEYSVDLQQQSRIRHATLLTSSGRLKLLASLQRIARILRLARWPLLPIRWRRYLRFSSPKITALAEPHRRDDVTEHLPKLVMMAGCLNNAFEPDVADSVRLLARHAELHIEEPSPAQCCGALALHAGDTQTAHRSAKSLVAAYQQSNSPVVILPSGCQRGVLDVLANEQSAEAAQLASRVVDLYALLFNALEGTDAFARNNATVSLYLPCTLPKAEGSSLRKLLSLVPGAEINLLHTPYGCCGAAGDHMLTSPARAAQMAAPLVAELMTQVESEQPSVNTPKYLLIPNTGCVWHLRAHLAELQPELPILHPLQWLARCLHTSSQGSAKLSS